jgi:hypothetical protein
LEEVSEAGSELFETDSSCGEGHEEVTINPVENPISADGQGRDMVAGSPTRVDRKETDGNYFKQEDEKEEEEEEEEGRQEMNGTIVYDSYAKLTGCEKICRYFDQKPTVKLN